jgi:hypothetical protein
VVEEAPTPVVGGRDVVDDHLGVVNLQPGVHVEMRLPNLRDVNSHDDESRRFDVHLQQLHEVVTRVDDGDDGWSRHQ